MTSKRDTPVIQSNGEITNPTTNVMADTGRLRSGFYEVLVVASASAAAEFVIQRRSVGSLSTVGSGIIFYAPASQAVAVPARFEVGENENIRVMMNANLTGDAVATITAQRIED